MSDDATPRLALPYLAAGQAQKHLTVNEALARLDGLVHAAAHSRTVAAQPTAPADGAAYILPEGRTGAEWALHPPGALLRYEAGDWTPLPAAVGAMVYVVDEAGLLLRDDDGWVELGAALRRLQNLERLGVGTTADAANPFAARLNNVLFTARAAADGGDGDLRLTLNKEAAADVLSLLFQSGHAGRAEIGLVGDDRLKLRVSADGAAWVDAVTVEPNGRVGLGAAPGAARLALGGVPPAAGALSVVGPPAGLSLAISDNVNSSLYVRTAPGGAIVGTDGGGVLHLAANGHGVADRKVTVETGAASGESALLLWIDTGAGAAARRVSVGAADSAGAGFRQLRVPN